MVNSTELLQLLLDGQHQIRQDIKKLEKKVAGDFESVTARLDNLRMHLLQVK